MVEANNKRIEFPKDLLRTNSDISSTFSKLIELQAWKTSIDEFSDGLKTSIFNILIFNLPGSITVDFKSFTNSINVWAQDIKTNIQLINRLHSILEHLIEKNLIPNLHLSKSSDFLKTSEPYSSPPPHHLCFVSCTSPEYHDSLPSGNNNGITNNVVNNPPPPLLMSYAPAPRNDQNPLQLQHQPQPMSNHPLQMQNGHLPSHSQPHHQQSIQQHSIQPQPFGVQVGASHHLSIIQNPSSMYVSNNNNNNGYTPSPIMNSNQYPHHDMNDQRLIHHDHIINQQQAAPNSQTLPPLQSVPKGKVGPPQNRPVLPPLAILHKRLFSNDSQNFPEPKRMKIGDLINSCT